MIQDREEAEYRRIVLCKLDRFGNVIEAQRFLKWCNSRGIADPFLFDDDKFDALVIAWRIAIRKEEET